MRVPVSASLAVVLVAVVPLMLVATAPRAAHAQANLTFTGGNGAPLTLTLATPIVYTITTNALLSPTFVFDAVGGSSIGFSPAFGNISFTIQNSNFTNYPTTINNGVNNGSITPDDTYFFGTLTGVTAGDIVTLSAGTLTTGTNIAGAPPANGSFTTYM